MPSQPNKKKLDAAAAKLRAGGDADLAEAVQQAADQLSGWEVREPEGETFPFKAERDLLEAVGVGNINAAMIDGAQRFLAGKLEPVRTKRTGSKASTSGRLPEDLARRLREACAAASEQAGWTVRPVNVFVAALEEAARRNRRART